MWYLSQNSRNFLPINWDPLSVMMEFWHPEPVDDVNEERHDLLYPKVCDWTCLDPFRELIYGDQQVSVAPGRLSQGPDNVQPSHGERPCDENRLKGVSREVSLAGVELAPLAGTYDLIGVVDHGGPVKALAERVSHEGTQRRVMAAYARVDGSDELAALWDGDAALLDAKRGVLVQLAVDDNE
jgi:hypothetical protein